MGKHRTEAAYDDEMFSLVARLIEIARREGVPLMVSAGMLDPEGEPMGCTTLVVDGADPELAGYSNRLKLAVGVVRGHSGFDTAAGLMITRHHPPRRSVGDA